MGHEYCNFDWRCAQDPEIDIRAVIKKQSKIENRLKSQKTMLVVPVGKPEGQRWRGGGEGGHHRCSLLHCSWVESSRVCPTAQWVKNQRRHRFEPWVGKIPEGGNGNPRQHCCLKNPMDTGACWDTVQKGCKRSDMTEWPNTYEHDL